MLLEVIVINRGPLMRLELDGLKEESAAFMALEDRRDSLAHIPQASRRIAT
jgi:hypothetical protein